MTSFPEPTSALAGLKGAVISIEFDDIVYSLQSFGGISEYWQEMTTRVEAMREFAVVRRAGRPRGRMAVQRSACQVFHSSYYRTANGPKTRSVTTVHDLAYELGHVSTRTKGWLHRLEHKRAYFASDALICVSESTRNDLLRVYPALKERCPIFVVHHGVRPREAPAAESPAANIGAPYVLFVGGRRAYKNFETALLGFAASRLSEQGYVLVCTGSALTGEEQQRIAHLGLVASVRSLGKVDRAALAGLYGNAHCLLYPSLFEGFGLPVLEAMQHACPVIAANRSVMPEIAGDAALLVDTLDPATISAALLDLCKPHTRERFVTAGKARAAEFSWDRSADQHASIYRSLT